MQASLPFFSLSEACLVVVEEEGGPTGLFVRPISFALGGAEAADSEGGGGRGGVLFLIYCSAHEEGREKGKKGDGRVPWQ